jgi:hypothetical protein
MYTVSAAGSCFQGNMRATYSELSALGLVDQGGGDKSTCNFIGVIEGVVVTVYDWKNDKPINPDSDYFWNVGGFSIDAVLFLEEALSQSFGGEHRRDSL